MELVLEDFMARQKELDEKMSVLLSEHSSMKAELLEKDWRLKTAERENRSLRERLAKLTRNVTARSVNGYRRRKIPVRLKKSELDRNDEKGDFGRHSLGRLG